MHLDDLKKLTNEEMKDLIALDSYTVNMPGLFTERHISPIHDYIIGRNGRVEISPNGRDWTPIRPMGEVSYPVPTMEIKVNRFGSGFGESDTLERAVKTLGYDSLEAVKGLSQAFEGLGFAISGAIASGLAGMGPAMQQAWEETRKEIEHINWNALHGIFPYSSTYTSNGTIAFAEYKEYIPEVTHIRLGSITKHHYIPRKYHNKVIQVKDKRFRNKREV